MANPLETSEVPRSPETKVENTEVSPESVEATPEAVDAAIDEAAKTVESDVGSLADFGSAEFARVTSGKDMPAMGPDEAKELEDSKRDIDEITVQGRGLAETFKARLTAAGAKAKRFGNAVVSAAVISGMAISPSEAAPVPDKMSKLEQAEKKPSAKEMLAEKLKGDKKLRKDLLERFASEEKAAAIEQELAEAFTGWDEERTRRDLAALAGVDAASISSDTFKEFSVLSEEDAAARGLKGGVSAEAKDDKIFFRAKKLVDENGKVDVARLHHTMDHEKGHVLTSTNEKDPTGEQVRLWDKAGVPHELNEGVTELLALRVAEARGEKLKDQSYAGGNLIAARLLEGLVGTKALAKDYLKGSTGDIKKNLDAQLGPGAFEAIMQADFPAGERTIDRGKGPEVIDRPEGLAKVLDIIRTAEKAGKGNLIDKIWKEAKEKDGIKEDMRITPDRRGVILVKEVGEAEMPITASGVFEDTEPVSKTAEPIRVFVWSNIGDRFDDPARAEKRGEGIANQAEMGDELDTELRVDFEAEPGFKVDKELQRAFRDNLAQKKAQAARNAHLRGIEVDDPNIVVDMRKDAGPIVEAFGKATTREAKTELSAKLQQETERIGRDTLAKVKEGVRKAREKKTPPK